MVNKAQSELIYEMAIAEKSNAQIAAATGLPLTEIYAYRSRNNLTRSKVRKLLDKAATSAPEQECDLTLKLILRKCGGRLENTVRYILSATEQPDVCKLCEHKGTEGCVGLTDCAAAVAVYLRGSEHDA